MIYVYKYINIMKKLFLLFVAVMCTVSAGTIFAAPANYASEAVEEDEDEVVFMVVETMPEFPGGQQAMFKFLSENIKYPEDAKKDGAEGRVICQFTVNKDGSISDVEVVRSSGNESLDQEARRVVQSMPHWKPGLQRSKPVRVRYTIPITFKL